MSRLYVWIDSDARERAVGVRAHQDTHLSVKFGSRQNSQDLMTIRVSWERGEEFPIVYLQGHDRRADFEGFEKL